MPPIVVTIVCVLAIALSVKSLLILGRQSAWTSIGWWLTIVYLIAVIAKDQFAYAVPTAIEYGVLVLLTIAFVIAGVRDERQAEPWWWPKGLGATRAEKRPLV